MKIRGLLHRQNQEEKVSKPSKGGNEKTRSGWAIRARPIIRQSGPSRREVPNQREGKRLEGRLSRRGKRPKLLSLATAMKKGECVTM